MFQTCFSKYPYGQSTREKDKEVMIGCGEEDRRRYQEIREVERLKEKCGADVLALCWI